MGRYIVDFYCPDANLVVEVDVRSHDGSLVYDQQRQARMEALGLRVLRVTNDEVLEDLDAAVARILAALHFSP